MTLELEKPELDSVGWGGTLNQNLTDIETAFNGLVASSDALAVQVNTVSTLFPILRSYALAADTIGDGQGLRLVVSAVAQDGAGTLKISHTPTGGSKTTLWQRTGYSYGQDANLVMYVMKQASGVLLAETMADLTT
jgi:hypothetical protein